MFLGVYSSGVSQSIQDKFSSILPGKVHLFRTKFLNVNHIVKKKKSIHIFE